MFDPGVSVGAGTFTINGVSITVAADDTVNTVLARINASGAGVTATFDSTTQLARLTSAQHTSSPITLAGDTSGFLAAMKLDGTAQRSSGSETRLAFDSPLASFAEYADVSAGTLTLNGQQIAIDPQTMTVRDLVAALDSVAGVDASLDEWTGALRVVSTPAGGAIQISDTSGILDTLRIAQRTYNGSPAATTVTEAQTGVDIVSNSAEVAVRVGAAAEDFTSVLNELAQLRDGDEQFIADLVAAATDAVGALRDAGIAGLTVGGEGNDVRLVVDRDALATALDALSNPNALSGIVAGVLTDFATRVDETIAARPPAPPRSDVQTISLTRPAVVASQAAAAALFQKALERVVNAVTPERQGLDESSDGALDLETRMKITAQVRTAEPAQATGLRNLLDTLSTNTRN
jgi:hypothetical protein